jgi:hypothetical protein
LAVEDRAAEVKRKMKAFLFLICILLVGFNAWAVTIGHGGSQSDALQQGITQSVIIGASVQLGAWLGRVWKKHGERKDAEFYGGWNK